MQDLCLYTEYCKLPEEQGQKPNQGQRIPVRLQYKGVPLDEFGGEFVSFQKRQQ